MTEVTRPSERVGGKWRMTDEEYGDEVEDRRRTRRRMEQELVFAGSVRSGLLTLRDMDRDLDRSTVTIKGKKTGLNRPRPQFSVHGPVLTSPNLNWFKTGFFANY